jgi:hypothetical protein
MRFSFAVSLLVLAGCASTGRSLADAARPNPLLPSAALICAQLSEVNSQATCLAGVEVEGSRSVEVARAAAQAEGADILRAILLGYGDYGYYSRGRQWSTFPLPIGRAGPLCVGCGTTQGYRPPPIPPRHP